MLKAFLISHDEPDKEDGLKEEGTTDMEDQLLARSADLAAMKGK